MGCGCGASQVTVAPNSGVVLQPLTYNSSENCIYTIEQLHVWLTKLICCKDKGLYLQLGSNAQTINKYLGIVMSAINYPSNPCYFKNDLDIISDFIILIANTGQC